MSGYGMGGYVGSFEDKRRIARQTKEREEERKKLEELRKKAEQGANAGLRKFGTGTSEVLEHAFKAETVGLVTRDEFVQKRETIKERLEDEAKRERLARELQEQHEKDRQRAAKRAKTEAKLKLSFGVDEDEEEEEEEQAEPESPPAPAAVAAAPATASGDGGEAAAKPPTTSAGEGPDDGDGPSANGGKGGGGSNGGAGIRRFANLGKDPSARAEFLPDKDRERQEEELREQLKKEWALRQAAVRAEPLDITYSYYNGTGHRRKVTVRKGDTIGQFLKAVQEQLVTQFREMRTTSVSSMMYVKEDIILPHSITFYDLIVNRARGKSGPLFQFDLQEHAVMNFDPRMLSQDSHAGKVVDRHWYNRNKHIFPASNWAVYDPDKAVQGKDDNALPPGAR